MLVLFLLVFLKDKWSITGDRLLALLGIIWLPLALRFVNFLFINCSNRRMQKNKANLTAIFIFWSVGIVEAWIDEVVDKPHLLGLSWAVVSKSCMKWLVHWLIYVCQPFCPLYLHWPPPSLLPWKMSNMLGHMAKPD